MHGESEHRLKILDILLEKKADVNLPDIINATPLMVTAGLGQVELMTRLLHAGADVNHGGGVGYTALKRAAVHGQVDAMHAMIVAFDDAMDVAMHRGEHRGLMLMELSRSRSLSLSL